MPLLEDRIWVFRYVDGRQETVLFGTGVAKGRGQVFVVRGELFWRDIRRRILRRRTVSGDGLRKFSAT